MEIATPKMKNRYHSAKKRTLEIEKTLKRRNHEAINDDAKNQRTVSFFERGGNDEWQIMRPLMMKTHIPISMFSCHLFH